VATCMALARDINKVATLVGVCPGFVGNRILFARQKQANKLVYQGVMPWDVDAALNAFGFKMGPFQMSDLAGGPRGPRPTTRSATRCVNWTGADKRPRRGFMITTTRAAPSRLM